MVFSLLWDTVSNDRGPRIFVYRLVGPAYSDRLFSNRQFDLAYLTSVYSVSDNLASI